MEFQPILDQLKDGVTPVLTWDFSDATLDCPEPNDSTIDVLITPAVTLTVGIHAVELCRTFLGCVYLTDGNLTTMTFIQAQNCPWYSLDEVHDDYNAELFEELMTYMEDHHHKLCIPQYEDVCETARNQYQTDIEEMA